MHEKDLIREKYADMAILDCAYGKDDKTFLNYCDELIDFICEKKNSILHYYYQCLSMEED